MGTDSAFFVAGLLGLLAGYIVGDFQRELRWRRDARANLALAVDRLPVAVSDDNGTGTGTNTRPDSDRDSDRGTARSLGSIRDGQARRRAVSRPNFGAGSPAPVRGRRSGVPNAEAMTYDCG